jgi:phospholipase C
MHGGWIPQVASLNGISIGDVHPLDSSRHSTTWADNFANDLQRDYPYAYTFIEPNFGRSFFDKQPPYPGPSYKEGSSQHPEDDPYGGECLIKAVYEAIRNSPLWNTSLLVIVYDEHGGFYDHMPPVTATAPGDSNVNQLKALNGFDFMRYGVRVPAVIVSPLIAKGTVDPTLYDHTSILATLQRMLGMGHLTQRDAAANVLQPLFEHSVLRSDEDCPRTLVSPVPSIQNLNKGAVTEIDQPLPASGNWVGFLNILLKTELEMCNGDGNALTDAVKNFQQITTTSAAKAYIQTMGAKIEALRNSGRS